ncbi:hypothetical protein [Isoptericola dokdonensis]|uniref:DUF732 domain-containing protein n=1 Tax=Isoptericola dokdonensis DS-3 TaxID=1300344 RepID=A0A168EAU8_9MICO|nr:hypothetical protein [Isoptericola dokdonensis]ANC29817.1 hypothetical protein I598_0226 [Isoptericola dokdonensis DS-3]
MRRKAVLAALVLVASTGCSDVGEAQDPASTTDHVSVSAAPPSSSMPTTASPEPEQPSEPASPAGSEPAGEDTESTRPLDDDNVWVEATPGTEQEAAFLEEIPEGDDLPEGYDAFIVGSALDGDCAALLGELAGNSEGADAGDVVSVAMTEYVIEVLTAADENGMCDSVASTE